jgi:TolB protein
VATGESRVLAVGSHPALSPDGQLIAYLNPAGQLWLMRADGSDQRRLTQGGSPATPTWSPDGRRLAYTAWNDDYCYPGTQKCAITDIWTVNVDGTAERKLLDRALSPVWSPGGSQLLYRDFAGPAEAGMAAGDLELARPDGSHIRRVATGLSWDGTRQLPAWSPSGTWIAYERMTWSGEHRLIVVRPNGSHRHRLTSGSSPAWSPSGRSIAFERKSGVFVTPSSGGRARRIAPPGSCPTWSPGGARLAFITTHYPRGGTLTIVGRDGKHRRTVAAADACFVSGSNDFPSPPSWSRDGRTIYFAG